MVYEKNMLDAQAAQASADLIMHAQEHAQQAREEGREEGRAEAREELRLEFAKNLLNAGMDAQTIAEITNLSVDDIKTLGSKK
jgi:predicted transposase/invertase (TIGR01784 family)